VESFPEGFQNFTLEAMAQAHLLIKRKEMLGYMKRAADWMLGNPREWDPATRRFLLLP
jgi:hypothetical protein